MPDLPAKNLESKDLSKDLPEGILEKIAKFLTLEEVKNFFVANKEIQQQLLSTRFLKLYQQHQEAYSDLPQDSDEELMIFQFYEDEKNQSAQRKSFAKLVEIFSKIKDCNFLAIRGLEPQDLMKAIKAEIAAAREYDHPYPFLYCESLSASSLESQASQEK